MIVIQRTIFRYSAIQVANQKVIVAQQNGSIRVVRQLALDLLHVLFCFSLFSLSDVELAQGYARLRIFRIVRNHLLDLLFGVGIAPSRLIESGERKAWV